MEFKAYTDLLKKENIPFSENEPMSRHTTFRIGGTSRIFVTPENASRLTRAAQVAKNNGIRYYILGKGSNVLFADEGYDGVVISTEKLTGCHREGSVVHCECGVSFTALARTCMEAGLAGLEFAYGIPGSVGGAVYMNAGAYGGEVSQVLLAATYFDVESGETVTLTNEEHNFGYRQSIYKESSGKIILSADFKLSEGVKEEILEKMDGYMLSRRTKQPLEYPSAGSVFKRCSGHFTGQMIEELGLKGYTVGGAQVSEKHAGFIINRGGATAEDVLGLIEYIKERVHEGYGLSLECEVIYIK